MMGKKMEDALNKQINAELYSSYLYLSMAANFESANLKGFAGWMVAQSQEEVTHAMRLYAHVVERGGKVQLTGIDGPKQRWATPLEAFQDAYDHELKVTKMIHDLVALSAVEKDYAAANMLQWFVKEQVEEEAQTDEAVQKLKMIGNSSGGLLMMDHHMGKRTGPFPAVK